MDGVVPDKGDKIIDFYCICPHQIVETHKDHGVLTDPGQQPSFLGADSHKQKRVQQGRQQEDPRISVGIFIHANKIVRGNRQTKQCCYRAAKQPFPVSAQPGNKILLSYQRSDVEEKDTE